MNENKTKQTHHGYQCMTNQGLYRLSWFTISKFLMLFTNYKMRNNNLFYFLNANSSKAIPYIICKLNIRKIN